MNNLVDTYPFNMVRAIFDSEEKALEVYLPGVRKALESLSEREQAVLLCRFKDKLTLVDCGKIFGITRERIGKYSIRVFVS